MRKGLRSQQATLIDTTIHLAQADFKTSAALARESVNLS